MRIEDVIAYAIVAIYSSPQLAQMMLLKGGSAMRLFDGLDARLSIDADFSVNEPIQNKAAVFGEMDRSLVQTFGRLGWDVIDFRPVRKPEKLRAGFPDWWGGWACEFKLVEKIHAGKTLETRRRNALIPEGANAATISLDFSEHEFCGESRTMILHGTTILAYSRELLVVEKLRAICQQHPEYAYRQRDRNRARDFFDIHSLTVDVDGKFIDRCRSHLQAVFEAKEVPLWILGALWDEAFVDEHRRGFDQVRDTVRGTIASFEVYLEHVRFLVRDLCPTIPARPTQL